MFKHLLETMRKTVLPTTLKYKYFLTEIYYSDTMFVNGLPVTSMFFYTSLLCLHHCPPSPLHQCPTARLPCAFCSSALYAMCVIHVLCAMPLHALHCTIVLPFRLFTASRPSHNVADERINISSLFFLFFSRRVLSLIIMETLRLLWRLCSLCSS
jgi:hypothetical protein